MKASSSTTNPKIVMVSVRDLKPSVYNPRKWSAESERQLSDSINRFGLVDPIIVNGAKDRNNIVIGGHFRLHTAKQLGLTIVPVVYVDIPNVEREKELNLRLNRNTGEWDLELLKEFDASFLLDVGFDDIDLSTIWDDALATDDDHFDVDKAVEEITKPVTQLGDVYQLGDHRLVCGDSTDPATLTTLMGGKRADTIYTDPKYNINLDYSKGISTGGKYGGKTNDRLSDVEYESFLHTTLSNAVAVLAPNAHVFCYCDQLYVGLIQKIYGELGIDTKRVCLWVKNNFNMTPQLAFNKAYEPCVYGTVGSPYLSDTHNLTEILNKEVAPGNRTLDDIIDLFDIWLAKRDPASSYEHPTQKPPTLHEKALRRCTKPGDIVLDIFAGSGSLMVACEQLKRTCYMAEIEPIFCDVIVARYEQLTGKKAAML
jgi:DNA modification methylase